MSLCLVTSLGACAGSKATLPVVDPAAPTEIKITLPPAPVGVDACLRRSFPEIPDRDLSTADVVKIIGKAKVNDRAKTACGLRAVDWINAVRRDFAR